jgi:hypothetical protein
MLSEQWLKSINWYKQGGAGIPLCIGSPILTLRFRMKKTLGVEFPDDVAYFVYKDGKCIFYHYFNTDKSRLEAQKLIDKAEHEPEFYKLHEKEFLKAGKAMEQTGFRMLELGILRSHPRVLGPLLVSRPP